MSHWKGIVAAGVLSVLAIFILQNREILELRFLSFEFQTRRAYMVIAIFGAGLLVGWITATISQLAARGREHDSTHVAERRDDDSRRG